MVTNLLQFGSYKSQYSYKEITLEDCVEISKECGPAIINNNNSGKEWQQWWWSSVCADTRLGCNHILLPFWGLITGLGGRSCHAPPRCLMGTGGHCYPIPSLGSWLQQRSCYLALHPISPYSSGMSFSLCTFVFQSTVFLCFFYTYKTHII